MTMYFETRIESKSTQGVYYNVWLDNNGWSCDCPHHTYRKAMCKHILDAQKIYDKHGGGHVLVLD